MRPTIVCLSAVILAAAELASASQTPTVIEHVTVIDGTGGAPQPDQTVVIETGRIRSVGPAGSTTRPSGAEVIDGRGRWLIPGLIDMHAHVTLGPVHGTPGVSMRMERDATVVARSLATLLAFGVTTIRDPGTADATFAVAIRDSVAHGRLVGPRLFVAGPVIDAGPFEGLVDRATTPEEVRAVVRRHAAAGVDYVKLYASLRPELVAAGIDEAHAQGIKAIAHLFATPWTDAANAGIDGILHSVPSSPALLPPERRRAFLANISRTGRFMFQWFEYYDPAAAEADSMISALVRHGVMHDPTLTVFEAIAWGDDPRIIESPDLALTPESLVRNWRTEFTLSAGFTAAGFDSARRVWPTVLRFVKQLYDRGVLLTAGTDANNPWVPAGPSLHRELELLVEAGISPLEVLAIATRNGARGLGIEPDVGTIEPGKRADLVLLSGDPSQSIGNTRRIVWVMRNGIRYDPEALLARR